MRELKVHSARVQVERLSQIFHCHRRAFYVPTRTPATKRSIPTGLLVFADEFPKRKIASIFLFVFVSVHTFTAAGDVAREIYFRELAVFGKSRNSIINLAIGFVTIIIFNKL